MITGSSSSKALNDSKVISSRSMSFIKNTNELFMNSSSTSKTFFDENESMNGRRRRKNKVKVRRKVSIIVSDKLKVANKYFFKIGDSNVM